MPISSIRNLCGALLIFCTPAAAAEPDFPPGLLWHTVNLCAQSYLLSGNPFPCLRFETQPGYAIVPAPGMTKILLVPTQKLAGIESPAILAEDSPNWWGYAWAARDLLVARAARPLTRNDIGLAINSTAARSQDQLHIHIGCVSASVIKNIRLFERAIDESWSPFPVKLGSQNWLAMKVEEEDLESDPFKLLAALPPAERGPMGSWGIAVVPLTFSDGDDGFVVLATRINSVIGTMGSGADIIDEACG